MSAKLKQAGGETAIEETHQRRRQSISSVNMASGVMANRRRWHGAAAAEYRWRQHAAWRR